MNSLKLLEEQQDATQVILDNELDILKNKRTILSPDIFIEMPVAEPVTQVCEIDPDTPFIKALQLTKKKITADLRNLTDIGGITRGIDTAAKQLRIDMLPVKSITRKHIKMILDHSSVTRAKWSNDRHNNIGNKRKQAAHRCSCKFSS